MPSPKKSRVFFCFSNGGGKKNCCRCLAIGQSYALLRKSENALALYFQGLQLATASSASISSSADLEGPPKLEVSQDQVQTLESLLQGLVVKYRGLVALERLSGEETSRTTDQPFIERLHDFAGDGLDLAKLVPYPPQMQPIPVKPLFLDVAWNYIDYPRDRTTEARGVPAQAEKPSEEKKGGCRGWFGFGR